jgi:hypothetical protein
MMQATSYLSKFFDEKEIRYEVFEIEDSNGWCHIIDTNAIIENIKQAPLNEQVQIAQTLSVIDYKNGNVNHFLKHLAGCLVKTFNA